MHEPDPYDYSYPASLIAQAPASPRDAARLLAHDRTAGRTGHHIFKELPDLLSPGSLLILNETKVIPARLALQKETGGIVKILFIGWDGKDLRILSEKNLSPGSVLSHQKQAVLRTLRKEGKEYVMQPLLSRAKTESLFEKFGEAPIPPYIKHSPLKGKKLREEYQTVFARRKGSVAAPTASLHFTPRLLAALRKKGVEIRFVTLHVGLGTFAPLTEENLEKGVLHPERYEIPKTTISAIRKAKREKRPVVAVGTTVVRTLESWAKNDKRSGETKLFIRPGFRFRIVDALITNFHTPRSSLMMLVSAFIGREPLLRLYKSAVRKRYRLFSFGDGMLLQ